MNISAIRNTVTSVFAAGTMLCQPTPLHAQKINIGYGGEDTFEYVQEVPPEGNFDQSYLKSEAPSPKVTVMGEKKNATFVVDVSQNILYHYDTNGKPMAAYLIASGKETTPTQTGLRVISHVETYPYDKAPLSTKRRRAPWDYGPKIIILNKLDPTTGETSQIGEFIHGNNNYESLGKHASHGCMRMDNEVMTQLAKQVKRGMLVLIKR